MSLLIRDNGHKTSCVCVDCQEEVKEQYRIRRNRERAIIRERKKEADPDAYREANRLAKKKYRDKKRGVSKELEWENALTKSFWVIGRHIIDGTLKVPDEVYAFLMKEYYKVESIYAHELGYRNEQK